MILSLTLLEGRCIRVIHRPLIPPLKTRASFDNFCRNETFWTHDSFYNAHDELVKHIWPSLESKERDAYCLGFRKRRGFNFEYSDPQENSSNSGKDLSTITQINEDPHFAKCLSTFFQTQ